MRTTLDIDDDVLRTAKGLARRQKETAGAVLSALARIGLSASTGSSAAKESKPTLRDAGPLDVDDHRPTLKGATS